MLTLEQCMMILDSIDGLVVIDEKGKIIYFDEKTAIGININAKDTIGRYITDILPLSKLHTVLETKQHDIGDFYFIDDKNHHQHPIVISTRHPIYRNNQFRGALEYDLFENYNVLKQFLNTTDSMLNKLNFYKKTVAGKSHSIDDLIGNGVAMHHLRREIYNAANSQSTIVITGETGSGKELVAHSIHKLSKRQNNPFVSINCSAIPNELFESEFFGYEEGAFTGAKKGGKPGKFELANSGTLFLDEINTLSQASQPKLLRALQEKEIDRVGGKKSIPVDVRIICSSNQHLESLVYDGQFREDLFFRLNVIPIEIPPLRDRIEDIPDIMYSMVDNFNLLLGRRIKSINEDVLEFMKEHDWPGNVRELQNAIERMMNAVDANTEILEMKHIPSSIKRKRRNFSLKGNDPIKHAKDSVEKELIMYALEESNGNKTQAAHLLKIARPVLYKKMERLKINDSVTSK